MRSALARLHRRKDKEISHGPEDVTFDTWNYSGKADGTAPQVNCVRYFSFDELKKYTNNFSQSNLIGQGGYGKVYKGYLPNGVIVAIKRAEQNSRQGVNQFKNEIELLSRVHHKNIVNFVGFCFEQGEQLLVYEYISKGSLHAILYGNNRMNLEWKRRLEIALDLARGLAYLHELVNPQIIHGDPEPSNVLLDENLNAKLIDFGLSILSDGEKEVDTVRASGTLGYIDPVYLMTGKVSEKSDVYTLGVVMLALLTGRRYHDGVAEEHISLVEKVKIAIDQHDQEYYGLRDVIDQRIMNQARNIGLRNFVQLALACLSELPSERPFMHEVMKQIEVTLQNN